MNSSNAPSTVKLKVTGRYEEAYAGGTLTPGHLVKRNSSNAFVVHATAGGFAMNSFVTEDVLRLKGGLISDTYASGDLTSIIHALPGDEIYSWLADGENVVIGDHLISAGDGTLKKTTGSPTHIVAESMEALDLTGVGNTTAQRLKVRVM